MYAPAARVRNGAPERKRRRQAARDGALARPGDGSQPGQCLNKGELDEEHLSAAAQEEIGKFCEYWETARSRLRLQF